VHVCWCGTRLYLPILHRERLRLSMPICFLTSNSQNKGFLLNSLQLTFGPVCGLGSWIDCSTSTPSLPAGWSTTYLCAVDTVARTVLSNPAFLILENNTPSKCIAACAARGYTHAGVEYGKECFCSNVLGSDTPLADPSECQMECLGDDVSSCGGSWRIQVYSFTG
jgi:hypothetical protein